MKAMRWCAVACLLAFAGPAPAQDKKLPDPVATALEKATELEVYSLSEERDEKGWHGAKVLGSTKVKDAEALKALVADVKKGVAEGDRGAKCFIPRHGIRITHDGKTHDLVICFECHWVHIYADGSDKRQVMPISDAPAAALNDILTKAKIPLAKPKK